MSHTSYCPHCGEPLAQRDDLDARPGLRRVPDNEGNVRRFRLGDGAAEPAATWQEFRRPARAANVASDVATPAAQALITALAACFVGVVLKFALDLPWLVVPTAGALAFALSWWLLLRDGRAALWEVETYQREPAPATVPPPATAEPARAATRLAVTLGNVHQERDLPIEPDVLLRLARTCANGRTFSERELVGAGLLSGRAQYEQVRDVLLAMNWLRWKSSDRRQGLDWTAPGRAGLRALADGQVTVEDLQRVVA